MKLCVEVGAWEPMAKMFAFYLCNRVIPWGLVPGGLLEQMTC